MFGAHPIGGILRSGILFAALGLLLAGCRDQPAVTQPGELPLEATFDPGEGPSIGHEPTDPETFPDFFWLPPVAGRESFTGEADLSLFPIVRVCDDAPDPCLHEAAVARFSRFDGTAGATVEVVDQHYQVDWDTGRTEDGEGLVTGDTYRVWVLLPRVDEDDGPVLRPVGFVTVLVAEDGRGRRAGSDDGFGLVDGRTLPLRFRLQDGLSGVALDCELDCGQFIVTDEAFDECTVNREACLTAPEAGWPPVGFEDEEVLITIERVAPVGTNGNGVVCFPGAFLPQGEACYTLRTFPNLESRPFQKALIWGMCQADDLPSSYELHQRTHDGDLVRPAPATDSPQLDCQDFQTASAMGRPLTRLARMLRPLGHFVLGAPLHARDNLSGSITSFSDFFYAESVGLEALVTPQEPRPAGETLTLEFRVVSDHDLDPDGEEAGILGDPVAGVPVDFLPDHGGVDPARGVSGQDGIVTVDWTLPAEPPGEEPPFTVALTATIPILVNPALGELNGPVVVGTSPSVTVTVEVLEPVGEIQGTVTGAGAPLGNAAVTIPQLEDVGTFTDESGEYTLSGVPAPAGERTLDRAAGPSQ